MIASVSGPELVLCGGVGEDGAVRFAVVVLVTVGRTIPTVCVGCVNGSSMTVEGSTWPAECTTWQEISHGSCGCPFFGPSSQASLGVSITPSPQRLRVQSGRQAAFGSNEFLVPLSHSSPESSVPFPQKVWSVRGWTQLPFLQIDPFVHACLVPHPTQDP